jgi:glycosyltransferase involved in cell wall biosynthesis
MLLPARYCVDQLRNEGIDIVCSKNIPGKNDKMDAFSWHGVPHPKLLPMANYWQSKNCQLVWSVDDDYRELPQWNPISFNDEQKGGFHWAAHMSDHLCVSTKYLGSTFNRETVWTPNMVECELYVPHRRPDWSKDSIRILWSGSTTHIGDLETVVEAVTQIIEKYNRQKMNVKFVFFGECHPTIRRRHLYNGVDEIEGVPIGDYHYALREIAPEIWLTPIAPHEFNLSKSNLKVLEGMALGAAVVATDIGPYKETVKHGENGMLACDTQGWVDALSYLIENPKQRISVAQHGQQMVRDRFNWHNPKCHTEWLNFYRRIANVI